ncbi:hypothetical protein [Streptomyces achromogenes]|uniref:hypothetical protein n=1 Tax=Streptomyces achromogenes TaxID=67255 RepID=UPI0036CFE659
MSALADDFGVTRQNPGKTVWTAFTCGLPAASRFVMEAGERARLDAYFTRIASRFSPAETDAAWCPADAIQDEALRGRVLLALR